MSAQSADRPRSRDGRWLLGWLIRLVGAAFVFGVVMGLIGALRKWGIDLPPQTLVTLGVLTALGCACLVGGQLMIQASPRIEEHDRQETKR